ncbi:transporter substrate-binding domain-containing protein [Pseudodesulfovibrio sp. zrk46]|uniref:substrate-binding periplasmic protein n=1 Tax=Pseudodesulfovibrio sp. zrk46 TaxID=2725288 RepID=UPI001448E423|nr:transporter substrate-binding domain-containing protein [Pseudodesulfovibrio sp. zrk46]QJB55264.1 transporter substrate-binding domain-containing protein [Pseudodesulfovibrio sp. zrk46]
MKKILALAVVLVLTLGLGTMAMASGADSINYMTEQYPPFNYDDGSKVTGISVDLLSAMLKEMGSSKSAADFKVLPWAQGYKRVQEEANTCLFAMTLTDARKPLFKWVGPFIETNISVIAKKGKVSIGSPADLTKYKYGVIRDDIGMQMLESNGVGKGNMDITAKMESNLKKLAHDRIDAVAYEQTSTMYQIKNAGMNTGDYEVAYVLKSGGLYYAFNKSVPDAVIAEFQKALDTIKANGTHQKVLDSYLK